MAHERVTIVDEHDRPIGHKPRAARTYADIYRVSQLWLTNPRGKILLAQRSFKKDRGAGKWGAAVAGTVESDETYESNIYKEAAEEIGLTGAKFSPLSKQFVDEPGEYRFFCQWFGGSVGWPLGRFKIQTAEVEQIRWVAPDQLRSQLRDNNGEFVRSSRFWPKLFL